MRHFQFLRWVRLGTRQLSKERLLLHLLRRCGRVAEKTRIERTVKLHCLVVAAAPGLGGGQRPGCEAGLRPGTQALSFRQHGQGVALPQLEEPCHFQGVSSSNVTTIASV